jgi:hypothetical protein
MTYVITHYQDEFIADQARIGKMITRDWTFYYQTPTTQLKQIYSHPDFDPETRHYCFKDNILVGFCTSKVEKEDPEGASLEFPLVLPDHTACESLLFERAVQVLSQKGVHKVRTRVSEKWGRTVHLAETWGYTFAELVSMLYTMDVKSASMPEIPASEEVTPYDHEKDFDQLVTIFVNHFNMTPEEARTNFNSLEKAGDQVMAHLVIRKTNTIQGRVLLLRDEEDSTQARMGVVYVTEEHLRKILIQHLIVICKEKGIETLTIPLFGDQLSQKDLLIPLYESLGFTHTCTISSYEKHI